MIRPYECASCGNDIEQGSEYREINGDYVHEECILDFLYLKIDLFADKEVMKYGEVDY